MYPTFDSGGEGASTPVFRPSVHPVPNLVVWPLLSPGGVGSPNAWQELYRLAYERAQAAFRPGTYQLACQFASN